MVRGAGCEEETNERHGTLPGGAGMFVPSLLRGFAEDRPVRTPATGRRGSMHSDQPGGHRAIAVTDVQQGDRQEQAHVR